MHFLNPVSKVRLVEVVRGWILAETSADPIISGTTERTAIEVVSITGLRYHTRDESLVNEAISADGRNCLCRGYAKRLKSALSYRMDR
jgi:hypothetical protein